MRTVMVVRRLFLLSALSLSLMVGLIVLVAAQGVEIEPNDTCATAQDMGAVSLPYSMEGSLDKTENDPYDVDFFRFMGTPGASVQVDLEGASTGQGTLSDPLLGFFDSTCNQVAVNDDYQSLNSRLYVTIPDDGVYIMAATSFADYSFIGDGNSSGTYRMTLTPFIAIGSINGQARDAETEAPLSGYYYPWTYVSLYRCQDGDCGEWMASVYADDEGRFRFETDYNGRPLPVSTYQVQIRASMYEDYQSDPFEVAEGEHKDLGAIDLIPIPTIGSIAGRVVDAIDGRPLPGNTYPYAYVYLLHCIEPDYCYYMGSQYADGEGRFRFEWDSYYGAPYPVGQYKVSVYADQYQQTESALFDVAEDQHLDIGDVPVRPYPVQFLDVQPCGNIPAQGGACRYSVHIRNGLAQRLRGSAWTVVNGWGIGSFVNWTQFPGGRPATVNLASGQTAILQFNYSVPGTVAEGAGFCTSIFVGQEPHAVFNTVGERWLFCINKEYGQFMLMPENEARDILRDRGILGFWPGRRALP